jgi:hypothetical protein
MALTLTKTAFDIFNPVGAGGAPRGAAMAECRTWGSELEAAIGAAASADDPTFTGGIWFGTALQPAALAASVNDYAPDAADLKANWMLTATLAVSITGIAPGATPEGRLLFISNNAAPVITLVNNSTASAAANRFAFTGDVALANFAAVTLIYAGGVWRRVG